MTLVSMEVVLRLWTGSWHRETAVLVQSCDGQFHSLVISAASEVSAHP